MGRYLTPGLVAVVDHGPGGAAALEVALRFAPRVVALAAEDAPVPPDVEVVRTGPSGISIDEALQLAADRVIPWVALRRDLADAGDLLGALLESTGRRATKDLPGFAALLVDRAPERIERILAVVDRRDEDPSGLMVLVAAHCALATGAEVDVLVLGAPGDAVPTPQRVQDLLPVAREQDLYEQALRSGDGTDRRARWIVVEDVEDRVSVVLDQVAAERYDLIIEDLSVVRLGGRMGRGRRIAAALGPGGPGEIPRALLERTDLPMVVVLDGIRLGVVPAGLVKGGAAVLLALGVAASAAPAASASSGQRARAATSVSETLDAYQAALDEATSMAAPSDVRDATQSAKELAADTVDVASDVYSAGPNEGSVSAPVGETSAEAQAAAGEPAPTEAPAGPAQPSPADDASPAEESPEELAPADLAPEQIEPEAAPKVDKKAIKAPKDVDAKDVRKAAKAADATAADLKAAREEFDKAQHRAVQSTGSAQQAADQAASAAALLDAAGATFEQTMQQTEGVISDATGLTGVLPGGASEIDLAVAEQAQADAYAAAEAAGLVADTALAEYHAAAEDATTDFLALEDAAARVTELDGTHEEAAAREEATVRAYRKAMAAARVNPAPGHHMTTPFGAHGSRWSTGRHTGIDFPAPTGSPVVAAASGTVVATGYEGSYGNRIVIEHANGLSTTYNHLSSITTHVGAEVTAGARIGRVGTTGNSSGPHLHFEVTRGGDGWSSGTFLDPAAWLAGKDG